MAKVAERGGVDWVVDQAAVFLGVEPADLKTPSARSRHRESWQIAAYAAWEVSKRSAVEIGRVLGGANHARIIVARETVRARIAKDPEFRDKVAKLLEDLYVALF